jgi:hypothetical protein
MEMIQCDQVWKKLTVGVMELLMLDSLSYVQSDASDRIVKAMVYIQDFISNCVRTLWKKSYLSVVLRNVELRSVW